MTYQTHILSNGLQLIHKPDTSAVAYCGLVINAGSRDEATPPAMSEAIAQGIAGAQLQSLPAAHLSAVEQPAEFAALVHGFINRL